VASQRLYVIASASGSGKTTFARLAADQMGVRCIELDALVHGPGWTETSNVSLRAQAVPGGATRVGRTGHQVAAGPRGRIAALCADAAVARAANYRLASKKRSQPLISRSPLLSRWSPATAKTTSSRACSFFVPERTSTF
jgi:hypothetical protein